MTKNVKRIFSDILLRATLAGALMGLTPFSAALNAAEVEQPALDISGFWRLSGRTNARNLVLTPKGQAIQDAYNFQEDDPSRQCTPASINRVWNNPGGTPIEIRQTETTVEIGYAVFDLRRTIPLADEAGEQPSTANLKGKRFAEMGSSYGSYVDDSLVVWTENIAPGYLATLRGVPAGGENATVKEVFTMEEDTLILALTFNSEELYEQPSELTLEFARISGMEELSIYGCTDADTEYDWFEELNRKAGEQQ